MSDLKRLLDNAGINDHESLKVLGIELIRRGYVGARVSEKDRLAEDLGLEYMDIFRDNVGSKYNGWGLTTSMLLDALIELRRKSRVMLVAETIHRAETMKFELGRMAQRLGVEYKKRVFCSSYDRVMQETRGRSNMVCFFDPLNLSG